MTASISSSRRNGIYWAQGPVDSGHPAIQLRPWWAGAAMELANNVEGTQHLPPCTWSLGESYTRIERAHPCTPYCTRAPAPSPATCTCTCLQEASSRHSKITFLGEKRGDFFSWCSLEVPLVSPAPLALPSGPFCPYAFMCSPISS